MYPQSIILTSQTEPRLGPGPLSQEQSLWQTVLPLHIQLTKMVDIERHFGRLITLVLLVVFIWRVALSGQMLLDKKIGSTLSKQYSKWRLFPSLSICLRLKNIMRKKLLENIDGHFRRLLNKVVLSFRHRNITESGWEGGKSVIERSKWHLGKIIPGALSISTRLHLLRMLEPHFGSPIYALPTNQLGQP